MLLWDEPNIELECQSVQTPKFVGHFLLLLCPIFVRSPWFNKRTYGLQPTVVFQVERNALNCGKIRRTTCSWHLEKNPTKALQWLRTAVHQETELLLCAGAPECQKNGGHLHIIIQLQMTAIQWSKKEHLHTACAVITAQWINCMILTCIWVT